MMVRKGVDKNVLKANGIISRRGEEGRGRVMIKGLTGEGFVVVMKVDR